MPFLAIDWGTTNRRIYRIGADGKVERSDRDDRGVLSLAPPDYVGEVRRIRDRFGDLPIVCAGMVGSNRGWREVPYLPCPAALDDLGQRLVWVEPQRTAIVPGLRFEESGRCDVMRGEEIQFLGAVAAGLAPASALLCQPGTHCKWATVVSARIDRFVTAMTGELFALIRTHSLLAAQIDGAATPGPDFAAGVAAAASGDLSALLFEVRADAVSGRNAIGDAASYVSGLLIGADVHQRLRAVGHVHILADKPLGALYEAAIRGAGGTATLIDSEAAFVSGITQLWRNLA